MEAHVKKHRHFATAHFLSTKTEKNVRLLTLERNTTLGFSNKRNNKLKHHYIKWNSNHVN